MSEKTIEERALLEILLREREEHQRLIGMLLATAAEEQRFLREITKSLIDERHAKDQHGRNLISGIVKLAPSIAEIVKVLADDGKAKKRT